MHPLEILLGPKPSRTPVALVNAVPEVVAVVRNMDKGDQALKQEIENFEIYISKRKDTLRDALWANIEMLLRERGLVPPEYDRTKHYFFIENGVIFFTAKQQNNEGEETYDDGIN